MPRLLPLLATIIAVLAPCQLFSEELSEATVLSAARSANVVYQRHLQLLVVQLHAQSLAQRVNAITYIGMLVDPATVAYLMPSLETARQPEEQIAACIALGHIGLASSAPALRELMEKAPAAGAREAALNALNQLQSATATDELGRAKDSDPTLTAASLTDLGTLASEKATDILANGLA